MSALRKVSQFLGHKADLGCSRCTYMAEREHSTRGASGTMSYFTWSEASGRTMEQVRIQAKEYQSAHSKAEAQAIQKKNGVRYTELLRLEYFDTILSIHFFWEWCIMKSNCVIQVCQPIMPLNSH